MRPVSHAKHTLINRVLLVALVLFCGYFALQPDFRFYHWVPHNWLRNIGVPYAWVLGLERHGDKFAHTLLAALLFIVITHARLYYPTRPKKRLMISLWLLISIILGAECAQLAMGRGFTIGDIIAGLVGLFAARFWLSRRL